MCNCKNEIEEKHRLTKGTDRVSLMRFGRTEITVTPITNKGEYSKHSRYYSEKWNYCPFCGEKMEQG